MMVETEAAVALGSGGGAEAVPVAVEPPGVPGLPGVPCEPLVPAAGPAAEDRRLRSSVTRPAYKPYTQL